MRMPQNTKCIECGKQSNGYVYCLKHEKENTKQLEEKDLLNQESTVK